MGFMQKIGLLNSCLNSLESAAMVERSLADLPNWGPLSAFMAARWRIGPIHGHHASGWLHLIGMKQQH